MCLRVSPCTLRCPACQALALNGRASIVGTGILPVSDMWNHADAVRKVEFKLLQL